MTGKIDKAELLAALAGGPAATGALAQRFEVTRQAVLHHLTSLRLAGLVHQVGQGRAATWVLSYGDTRAWPLPPPDGLGEDTMWRQTRDSLADALEPVSAETMACLNYGVTEMLNNAIDHSEGSAVTLSLDVGDDVVVAIADDGIGAVRKVREHFTLPSDHDAIAHIAKGRQTTAPRHHTGQGLFFTSKLFRSFQLEANGVMWKVDNGRDDATVGPSLLRAGTRVVLRTEADGTRRPKDIFDLYSDPDDLAFDRSKVRVSLVDHGADFVSRSEAKRLAAGLESHASVELDFTGVREVGQGFVDELFRVWTTAHPETRLHAINTAPDVAFMIERGLPRT